MIAASSVIIGAGFGLLALAHTAVLLAVAVTVWSVGELAQWPVAAAYTTSLAPHGMTGRYAGARSLCYGTALLIAPLAGSGLYRLSPTLLWSACAAAGICAAAAITPSEAVLRPRPPAARSRQPASPPADHPAQPGPGPRREIHGPARFHIRAARPISDAAACRGNQGDK